MDRRLIFLRKKCPKGLSAPAPGLYMCDRVASLVNMQRISDYFYLQMPMV